MAKEAPSKVHKEINQSLKFKVAHLLQAVGGMTRHYLVQDVIPQGLDEDLALLTPITGELKFVKTGGNILVTGRLYTVLELPCTRCLEPLAVPITMEVEEVFMPSLDIVSNTRISHEDDDDFDEATLIDEQNVLNLTEIIRQELYLSQPSQVTCQEINHVACADLAYDIKTESEDTVTNDNEDDEIDDRWAGLLALRENFTE